MDVGLLGTIAGSMFGSAALTEAAKGYFSRRKTDADSASTMVDALLKWQGTLTARIEILEKANAEKDSRISELISKVAQLESEVPNHTPCEVCRVNSVTGPSA